MIQIDSVFLDGIGISKDGNFATVRHSSLYMSPMSQFCILNESVFTSMPRSHGPRHLIHSALSAWGVGGTNQAEDSAALAGAQQRCHQMPRIQQENTGKHRKNIGKLRKNQ